MPILLAIVVAALVPVGQEEAAPLQSEDIEHVVDPSLTNVVGGVVTDWAGWHAMQPDGRAEVESGGAQWR